MSDYNKNSISYDRVRFGSSGGKYVNDHEQKFVATMIGSSTILEVGTATGRFAVSLTNRGEEYTGIDLSQKMCHTTLDRTDHKASIIQMDGCHLAFKSHFDY